METKSLSSPLSAADETVLLTESPLDPAAASALVEAPDRGAVVLFEGRVRGTEAGLPIAAIVYDAYRSMAGKALRALVQEAWDLRGVRLAVFHRLGRVPVGETGLIVAAGAGHRAEAFEACRWAVDAVKTRAPIWKISFEPMLNRPLILSLSKEEIP